jgi:hypothetical protein
MPTAPLPSPSTKPLTAVTALHRAKVEAVRGRPVGGLWRERNGRIEVLLFGNSWNPTPAAELRRAPGNVLLWQGIVLAPA